MSSVSRTIEFIEFSNIKKSEFYQKTGLSNGYLDKVKELGADKIESIIKVYPNINLSWLITGTGSMFGSYNLPDDDHSRIIAAEPQIDYEKTNEINALIPLLPMEAFAGRGLGVFNDLKIERFYQIHEFQNADFLMRVNGDSMSPKFNSGDIIGCTLIRSTLFFQWNKPHVIYTSSQGVLIKRIKKSEYNDHVCCVSDNVHYDPFDVPKTDIVDIALVIGVVRVE